MTPRTSAPLRIELLSATHDVDAFDAGTRHAEITSWFQFDALREQQMGLAKIFVAVAGDDTIAGFFTLSPLTIPISDSVVRAFGLPLRSSPTIAGYLLGKIGIHRSWLGQGLGDAFDARAIETARHRATSDGAAFLAVNAKDDALSEWYEQLGFVPLSARRLLIPLSGRL